MKTQPRRTSRRTLDPRTTRRLFAVLFFVAFLICAAQDSVLTNPMPICVVNDAGLFAHADAAETNPEAFIRRQTVEPSTPAQGPGERLSVQAPEIPIVSTSPASARSALARRIVVPVLQLCVPVGWHAPPSIEPLNEF